jgi:hypothetical protein
MRSELGTISAEIVAQEDCLTRLVLLGNHAREALVAVDWSGASRPPNSEQRARAVHPASTLIELEMFAAVEDNVPTPDWAPTLTPGSYAPLLGAVSLYHAALPFAEAERRWFYETIDDVRSSREGAPYEEQIAEIARCKARLTVLGRQRLASAGELLERWCQWRTDDGPFARDGTFGVACKALDQIGRLLPE